MLPKDKDQQINLLANYILQDYIGQSSFGKVYKIKKINSNEIFSARILNNEIDNSPEEQFDDILQELNIISRLDHPSVLKYIGFSPIDFKKRIRPVIITEYTSNGTLEGLISIARNSPTDSKLNDTRKLIIIYGIASAMAYLHSHNIIHRDLKPSSILIDDNLNPKISEFGHSEVKHSNFERKTIENSIYISPEIIDNCEFSKSSDVYAFSIIMFELLTNEKPFNGFNLFEIPAKVKSGYRPIFNKEIPESYQKLIVSCWSEKPSNRPTFDEIVNRLKNDRGFITEKVDEAEFLEYINYINQYNVTYDQSKKLNCLDLLDNMAKQKELPTQYIEYFSIKPSIFQLNDYIQLEECCKNMVKQAGFSGEKLYRIGKCLFEGENVFPRNPMYAIEYLKESMKTGFVQSAIYYCEKLIKGDIIHSDIIKAKKILDKEIKDKEPGTYCLLHAKICKKEENYEKCRELFEKSILLGNIESMYEYGRLIFKGKIDSLNKEVGIEYIKKSIEKGCVKAMFKYGNFLYNENKNQESKDEGIRYIKMAAEKGHKDALLFCFALKINEDPPDEEKANLFLKKAAYKGHIKAMHLYGKNRATKKESITFIKKAADAGNLDSIDLYGKFVGEGDGVPLDHVKSAKYFKIAADGGNFDAMLNYGICLVTGQGVETDKENASRYFKRAADNGNLLSMLYYAFMIYKGDGIPMNKEEASKYFKMAADGNNADAMFYYAFMIYKGDGIRMNKEESVKYFKMSADKGNVDAMFYYANILYNGDGIPMNKEAAAKYFKMAADGNNIDAMFYYANILYNGDGISINKKEASKYFKMAADKGNVDAMYSYAFMLKENDGITMNKEEAVKYFKMAADGGEINAMLRYANMLHEGDGIPMNKEEAANYFNLAADEGNVNAMICYANILYNGDGIQMNKEEAANYFKMAADEGNVNAMLRYANMLQEGDGISMNKEEAEKYFKMAEYQNDESS